MHLIDNNIGAILLV